MSTSEMAPWNHLSLSSHSNHVSLQNGLKMGARLMLEESKTMRELVYWDLFRGYPPRKTNAASWPPCRPPRAACIPHLTKGCSWLQLSLPGSLRNSLNKNTSHSQHSGSTLLSQVRGNQTQNPPWPTGTLSGPIFFCAYYSLILDHRGLATTLSPSFTGQRGEAAQGHSVY